MRNWGFIDQKGPWISVEPDLLTSLSEKGFEVPDKFQGEQKLLDLLENNSDLSEYLYDLLKNEVLELK